MTARDMEPGETAVVRSLELEGQTRRRFLDLGLVPGTLIEAVMKSPLGDPMAYRFRGTVVAIREEDAERIEVERDGD